MGLIKTLSGQFAKIKVIGVGGGGNNAINSMIKQDDVVGVDFVAVNTDSQALLNSLAPIKIQIGEKLTKGLGAGGNPEIGRLAADESRERLLEILQNTDMVFITGGMGGGTCTGASPVIAKIAKEELGILTIAVITKPFLFEGTRRMVQAEDGIRELRQVVDALIIIPNQKVMEISGQNITLPQAFELADSVLTKGTKAIAELITTSGLINLDFADIKSVMHNAGTALMGVGEGTGEGRAQTALDLAIASPLIEVNFDGAKGVLINIAASSDLTMAEVEFIAKTVTDRAAVDANIIFGAVIDTELNDTIRITVIATGFDQNSISRPQSKSAESPAPPATNKTATQIKDLPAGVEILDEYDIPAFLRQDK